MLQKSIFQKSKDKIREWTRNVISPPSYVSVAAKLNFLIAGIAQLRAQKPLSYPIDCGQPLIYISEPPRSGGTLMRSLLDGHKQLHVFPHELSFDKKEIYWALDELVDLSSKKFFEGCGTSGRTIFSLMVSIAFTPFTLIAGSSGNFLSICCHPLRSVVEGQLQMLTFPAFFNAWIDYQGLYGSDKRYKVAFCPWPEDMKEADIRRFFDVYPDGYRIHVVRDPFSWWASYRTFHRDKECGALPIEGHFDKIWLNNCNLAKKLGTEMPDRYVVVLFDDLLREPQRIMRELAERVGIDFQPCMLEPAINNIPKNLILLTPQENSDSTQKLWKGGNPYFLKPKSL